MIARFATLFAALLLAVMPTVRAMCDVGCVTVPNHESRPEPTAGHCTPASAPASEAPSGDDCGHNHDASDAMVTAIKSQVAHAPVLTAIVIPLDALTFARTAVLVRTGVPPPAPPPTRPLPLRI